MTSSSEQTTALIAEAREAVAYLDSFDAHRLTGTPEPTVPARLAERLVQQTIADLADALEEATKSPETATCLECEGEGAFNVTFVYGNQRVTCEDCGGTGRVPVAAPRVVSTVAELDALPVGALIDENLPDRRGFHLWKMAAGWKSVGGVPFPSDGIMLPATVLWVGGTE